MYPRLLCFNQTYFFRSGWTRAKSINSQNIKILETSMDQTKVGFPENMGYLVKVVAAHLLT